MVRAPTVLVLGAGASKPYGFPLGTELKDKICAEGARKQAHSTLLRSLEAAGHKQQEALTFINQLYGSSLSSVDMFLEYRPEFLEVGKAAIAWGLVPLEQDDKLHGTTDGRWYPYLFSKLLASFDSIPENKLTILTYNYDRSLERFLVRSVCNTFNKSETEAAACLAHIPIIHLHGQLGGYLPKAGPYDRSYTPEINSFAIQQAAMGIKGRSRGRGGATGVPACP